MASEARQLIDAMEAAKNPVVAIAAQRRNGPVLPIFSINFRSLPGELEPTTKNLMIAIQASKGVLDRGPPNERGNGTIGAMRQVHTNDPRYLPINDISFGNGVNTTGDLSGRAIEYCRYTRLYKGHTNDRGEDAIDTGFVEYTAGNTETYPFAHLSEMRIVFDYVRNRIFLSPFHYQSWTLTSTGETIEMVDKPAGGTNNPSPFYWIVEIPKVM